LWLPFLVGVLACLAWVWADGRSLTQPIIAADVNQHRANAAPPVPNGTVSIEQTFFSKWDGLREIDLLIAGDGRQGSADGRLHLRLFDDDGAIAAERQVATLGLAPDQSYVFRFSPLPDSAGRRYTLRISGNAENPVSVWGYNLEAYGGGEMRLQTGPLAAAPPPTQIADLRLITRYQLTWQDGLRAVGSAVARTGFLLATALLFLPLPGVLLLLIWPRPRWDPLAWAGGALALGISGWALLWQWVSLVNGRFSPLLLWLLLITGWTTALFLWRRRHSSLITHHSSFHWEHAALLALLLIAFAVRLLAVRDLAFPPWVDASRHALITAVMTDQGQTPSSYAPYLPVDRFPYHFGYHTLSAACS
jgi:hypothetical protein